jgi:hypothetical protein
VAAGRNAVAAVAVLLGLGALVAVPAAIQAGLPDEGPLPAVERLDVGFGVTLRPPADARLELAGSRPGAGEVVLLTRGLRLKLTAVEVPERPADFVSHTRHKFSRDDGLRAGPPQPARTGAGVDGERGDLRPDGALAGRPGCYGVFVAESVGAVAVISPVAGCAEVPTEVWASVASIEFEPAQR